MQLIVTRPRAQAAAAVAQLRADGVDAVALPLLEVEPIADPAVLRARWAELRAYKLVMFVSANAVQSFFAAAPADAALWPRHTLAASTGPGTTAALVAAGVPAAQVVAPGAAATQLDSEALWQELSRHPWAGTRALIVRGEGGREWLAQTLGAAGARVDMVAAYRRTLPRLDGEEAALLAAAQARPQAFVWHFTSSEAVRHLPLLAPGATWSSSSAFAAHERIAQAAREIGFAQVQTLAPGAEPLLLAWRAHLAAQGLGRPGVGEGAPIQSRPL
jgi:uroporphyrinogen-III synthase